MEQFEKLRERLNDALESLRKDNIAHIDMESLSTELAALRAEREEEKKELQTLYDQLSSALSEEGRAD